MVSSTYRLGAIALAYSPCAIRGVSCDKAALGGAIRMNQEFFLAAEPYNHEYPRRGQVLTKTKALQEGAVFFSEKSIAENGNTCPCGKLERYGLSYIGTTYEGEAVYGVT